MINGGTTTRGVSSRRHSCSRATKYRKGLLQQSTTGPRRDYSRSRVGGGHLHLRGTPPSLTSAQKAERVHNIFQQHRAKLSRGLTEQDIAKIIEEDEEADDLLRSINPEIMGMEEQQIAKRLRRYSEPSLGDLPIEKPDGYRRFMATQLNGCATPVVRASKVARSTSLINHYDVDVQSYIEHGLNMGRFKASETFDSFFDAEILLRSVTGHNQTENPETAHQQGGTGLMCTSDRKFQSWKKRP